MGHRSIQMTVRYAHLAPNTSSLLSSDWPDIIRRLYEKVMGASILALIRTSVRAHPFGRAD